MFLIGLGSHPTAFEPEIKRRSDPGVSSGPSWLLYERQAYKRGFFLGIDAISASFHGGSGPSPIGSGCRS